MSQNCRLGHEKKSGSDLCCISTIGVGSWHAEEALSGVHCQRRDRTVHAGPSPQSLFLTRPDAPDEASAGTGSRSGEVAKKAMRALAIVARGGKYYFFFSASDIHSEEVVGGIGVAVADHPAGPLHRDHGRAVRALPGAALERISTRSGMVRPA
jgi:hypothetical protein